MSSKAALYSTTVVLRVADTDWRVRPDELSRGFGRPEEAADVGLPVAELRGASRADCRGADRSEADKSGGRMPAELVTDQALGGIDADRDTSCCLGVSAQ